MSEVVEFAPSGTIYVCANQTTQWMSPEHFIAMGAANHTFPLGWDERDAKI